MSSRQVGFSEGLPSGVDQQAFERLFSPEFRNRLDARISFKPLTPAVMERIVDKFIDELQALLAPKRVRLELSSAARSHLAEKGYDPSFGARPLRRLIDETIKRPLTDDLLFGSLTEGGEVRVEVKKGSLELRSMSRRRAS